MHFEYEFFCAHRTKFGDHDDIKKKKDFPFWLDNQRHDFSVMMSLIIIIITEKFIWHRKFNVENHWCLYTYAAPVLINFILIFSN